MAAFGKPISFDGLIREISSRYHLGPKGRSLVEEAVDMIARHPGGISGFLDRFRDAGFTSEVSSWLAGTNPVPLSGLEIEQTLGADFIGEIAKRAGVSQRFARTVLGYAIPKIIGMLAHSGFLDMAIPPSSLQAGEAPQHGEEQFPLGGMEEGGAAPRLTPRFSQMVIPAASLLVVLGLLGYFVSSGRLGHRGGATKPATVTAQNAPAAAPPAPPKSVPTVAQNAPAAAPPAPPKSVPTVAQNAPAAAPPAPPNLYPQWRKMRQQRPRPRLRYPHPQRRKMRRQQRPRPRLRYRHPQRRKMRRQQRPRPRLRYRHPQRRKMRRQQRPRPRLRYRHPQRRKMRQRRSRPRLRRPQSASLLRHPLTYQPFISP